MISISGVFAVTFSVVFAYVADVTTTEDRSRAYGLVSATFAASLVIFKTVIFDFRNEKSNLIIQSHNPILGYFAGIRTIFA